MKTIKISDFLTDEQIKKAAVLRTAAKICSEVIEPNIDAINFKLNQENNPIYLAYLCEYVFSQVGK
jgi:hypothetical protein